MARVVDRCPSSDDDLENIGNRRIQNSRVTLAPEKSKMFPRRNTLVPRVKASPPNRRIRRLNAGQFASENPLFKPWTGENNSPLESSTKNSTSLLGRRTASWPNAEECGDDAEWNAPKSAATWPVPESNNRVQSHVVHPCDPTGVLKGKIEDQLMINMRGVEADDSEAVPCELAEDSDQHDLIQDRDIYIVERIIGHKGNGRRRRYFVKWQGYDGNENSWVTRKDFVDETFPRQYDEQC